jgi:hypothetical protein
MVTILMQDRHQVTILTKDRHQKTLKITLKIKKVTMVTMVTVFFGTHRKTLHISAFTVIVGFQAMKNAPNIESLSIQSSR